MPGRIQRRRRSRRIQPRFSKMCQSSHDQIVSPLRSCTRQLKPRSNCCKPHSACWAMRKGSRRRIWNGPFQARSHKLLCLPCRHRSSQRRDSPSGRRSSWVPPRRQSSRLSRIETECPKASAQGERRLEELQLQGKSPVAPVSDVEAELVSSPSASGRAPRIVDESCRKAYKAEGLFSRGLARIHSSVVVSVDGRLSCGRAGSPHPRRPQPGHRTEFDVDEES